jgi:phosphotransferase system HPr (HPr) family protein
LSSENSQAACEVEIPNPEGLHARPVMSFVDLASRFSAKVCVRNVTNGGQPVDGKSAMQMMLLEGTQGCVLRIEADGSDAHEATDALSELVRGGFGRLEIRE